MNSRTHFGDLSYTWDSKKNKTSESITGVMSGYGVTAAGTTGGNEDLCFSSSLPPPDSSLLIDIDANGTADVNFQYDALGRRVARSGTGGSVVYVQMDQQTIADYPVGGAATTPTFRYVYASYIDEPVVRKTAGTGGTLVYFHRNHQYSITALTTSAGSIAERYAYSAYGLPTILDASGTVLPTSNFSLRYSFTGREWDATLGLHHFRARWMSPSAGRFVTRDPIGYVGRSNGIYEYCGAFPLRALDPSGNLWVTCYPFYGIVNHCELTQTCTPGRQYIPGYGWTNVTCSPVGKSTDCSRELYKLDGTCPKTCCNATDQEILRCLQEFPYNAGSGSWGDNCQANTAHRLAKCCMATSWVPEPWGFPSNSGNNPHCLEWGVETRYACNQGGCFPYTVRVCMRRLPDDYYGQPVGCLRGHYETRTYCGMLGACVNVEEFVCDVFDVWQPPSPFSG